MAAQDGTQSVDLNQYIPGPVLTPPGSVSQIIATTPGTTYLVDFYMAGNPDPFSPSEQGPPVKTMDVSFGTSTQSYSFDVTGHTFSNPGWIEQSFFSTATSANTMLSFVSTSNGYAGMIIDNVRVTAVPAFVPEPGAPVAGVIGSVAGVCLLLRRRRKVSAQST